MTKNLTVNQRLNSNSFPVGVATSSFQIEGARECDATIEGNQPSEKCMQRERHRWMEAEGERQNDGEKRPGELEGKLWVSFVFLGSVRRGPEGRHESLSQHA